VSERAPESERDLDRILAECLEELELEGSAALDRMCATHPKLAAGLRRRVGLLAAANLVSMSSNLDRLPRRLGDFEPLERLGEGAMGVVHRARQASTGREVALKLVRPSQLVFGAARARFRREVELSARLHHPTILPVIAVGEDEGLPWFALELVRGASLSAVLERLRARFGRAEAVDPGALPRMLQEATPATLRTEPRMSVPKSYRDWALGVGLAVARAVAHAHENGVLHRDVKPSNVLLGLDGRVFLTDFGLAGEPGEASLTGSHAAVGSLPYMAPEVLEGSRPDARSDIYGLGALTYEITTLRRPFEVVSSAALVRAILEANPPSPRKHAPRLGSDGEGVLQRAMERDPRARYATAYSFAEDLQNLLERRPTLARPAGPWLRLWRFVERRPAASAALVLAALFFLGTPSVLAWTQTRARKRVEKVNLELDKALDRAREERARADENLERAAEAVDSMLTETGSVMLDEVPMMQSLKRDLLERALGVLGELEPQAPSEPRHVLQSVNVNLAAAQARHDLRETESARAHAERGLARLDACGECPSYDPDRALSLRVGLLMLLSRIEQDGDPEEAIRLAREVIELGSSSQEQRTRQEVLLAHAQLHDLYFYAGDSASGRKWLDAALVVLNQDESSWPRDFFLQQLGKFHGMRGAMLYMENDDEGALRDLRRAIELLGELGPLRPESLRVRIETVTHQINLSSVLIRQGALDEALEVLKAARATQEELVRQFPSSQGFRVELGGILINLGLIYDSRGERELCGEAWEAAAEAGRVVAAHPEASMEALFQGGLSLSNLSSFHFENESYEAAIALAKEARGPLQRVIILQPGHTVAARACESTYLTEAYCALALGHLDEARALVIAAEETAPEERLAKRSSAEGWLKLAERLPEEERPACYERALVQLQRAVALGWNDPADLVDNPFLDPLRALPGFPAPGPP
jgi:serine/threonine protein kinase